MVALAAIVGTVIVVGVLVEAFGTVVLPRRVTRRFRLTRAFYRYTWAPFSAVARRIQKLKRREESGFFLFRISLGRYVCGFGFQ